MRVGRTAELGLSGPVLRARALVEVDRHGYSHEEADDDHDQDTTDDEERGRKKAPRSLNPDVTGDKDENESPRANKRQTKSLLAAAEEERELTCSCSLGGASMIIGGICRGGASIPNQWLTMYIRFSNKSFGYVSHVRHLEACISITYT